MNERIKELAIEAGYDMDMQQHQKFAELIVNECTTVIEKNLFQGIGWNTSRAVRKHFGIGVEE